MPLKPENSVPPNHIIQPYTIKFHPGKKKTTDYFNTHILLWHDNDNISNFIQFYTKILKFYTITQLTSLLIDIDRYIEC